MLTNDTPIITPEDDQFGVDPFAQALARAIAQMSGSSITNILLSPRFPAVARGADTGPSPFAHFCGSGRVAFFLALMFFCRSRGPLEG